MVESHLKEIRQSDNLRTALNIGNTLSTRFWLALMSVIYGAGFILDAPSWMSHPSFDHLNDVLPTWAWGVGLIAVGSLCMWRAVSMVSRPWYSWMTNFLMVSIWCTMTIVRWYGMGSISLLSTNTVVLIMAVWCLMRTEATYRDKATA